MTAVSLGLLGFSWFPIPNVRKVSERKLLTVSAVWRQQTKKTPETPMPCLHSPPHTGKAPMMTEAELQQLRGMLTLQRAALVRTLCTAVAEERLEPAFIALLADVQTAITAVDAELTEGEGAVR